jgi:integrase
VSRANCAKHILRYLWEHHGAPKLDGHMAKYTAVRPRNVTITDAERDALLAAAKPHLKLWILLCSDLAIRSGTAARLGSEHYDPQRRTLTFVTKCNEHLKLFTTAAIESLILDCDLRSSVPFVRQLWPQNALGNAPTNKPSSIHGLLGHQWRLLCKRAGIKRRIVPHDLRRTAAVAIYRHTADIRDAQSLLGHKMLTSTLWYLDHDVRPISRETLEAIKRPFLVPPKEKTA